MADHPDINAQIAAVRTAIAYAEARATPNHTSMADHVARRNLPAMRGAVATLEAAKAAREEDGDACPLPDAIMRRALEQLLAEQDAEAARLENRKGLGVNEIKSNRWFLERTIHPRIAWLTARLAALEPQETGDAVPAPQQA
jgi:hypothetical protein